MSKLSEGESKAAEAAFSDAEEAFGAGLGLLVASKTKWSKSKAAGEGPRSEATWTEGRYAANNVKIPDRRAGHIFRDAPGHLKDTPANRQMLREVGGDPAAHLGRDRFGNTWSARANPDGTRTWVQMRGKEIINGGVNPTSRVFHSETGLSAPKPPGG